MTPLLASDWLFVRLEVTEGGTRNYGASGIFILCASLASTRGGASDPTRHSESLVAGHGLAPTRILARSPGGRPTCPWRIPEITQRWASDTVRDSAAASGMKQSLTAHLQPLDLAAVLVSPSERGAC